MLVLIKQATVPRRTEVLAEGSKGRDNETELVVSFIGAGSILNVGGPGVSTVRARSARAKF